MSNFLSLWTYFTVLFKPGLRNVAQSTVRLHYKTNETLKSYRYGALRSGVRACESNKRLTLAILLFTYVGACGISYLAYPLPIGPTIPDGVNDFHRDLVSFNTVILGVQATFVGLLFPIVIALVSLLNDGRITYENRLKVFLAETESSFVGLSGLALVVWITTQLLLFSQLPPRVGAAVSCINLIWFSLNVVVVGFFLFQTIQFVQPKRRFEMVKRHIASRVWREQLTGILLENRWRNAVHYKLWPDPEDLIEVEAERPVLSTHRFNEEADHRVFKKVHQPQVVHDIFVHRVGYVLERWLKRLAALEERSEFCWVEFPIAPNNELKGTTVIAQITKGPEFDARERSLLKSAFVTRRKPVLDVEADVSESLKEVISDLIALTESRRIREFETLLDHLTDLHAFLYNIAEVETGEETFNYARMEDFAQRTLSISWARHYRDLHQRTVAQLGETTEMFDSVAYSAPRLMARVKESPPSASSIAILVNSSHLITCLLEWAENNHHNATGDATNAGMCFQLAPQYAQNYAAAWRSFSAAWERTVGDWKYKIKRSGENWATRTGFSEAYSQHLLRTALFIGQAAAKGDRIGSQWAIDLFLKWHSALVSGDRENGVLFEITTEGYTQADLSKSWEVILSEIQPKYASFGEVRQVERSDPKQVWNAIFANTWEDVRTALLLVLIRWGTEFGPGGQALDSIIRLNNGTVFDKGWHGASGSVARSFDDHFESIIRIASSGHRFSEATYISRVDGWLEQFQNIVRPDYVSMRIYSGSGGASFSTMFEQQAILLAATIRVSDRPVRITVAFQKFLDSANSDDALELVKGHLEKIDHWLELKSDSKSAEMIGIVAADETDVAIRCMRLRGMLRLCIDEIENRRTEEISQANIDPQRLNSIALAAASHAFSPEHAGFPLSKFREISFSQEELETFTLRALNQNRGEYTTPLFAQPVSNEESYWQNAMKLRVSASVLWDVLRACEFKDLTTLTPQRFWESLEQSAEEIASQGANPILLVPSRADPRWVFDWSWGSNPDLWKPENLNIWREESKDDAYVFHLNDLPVYIAPISSGTAYMMAQEVFDAVQFSEREGKAVLVTFEDDENDPWKGELHLKFGRSVSIVQNVDLFRFRYEDDEDDSLND